MNEEIVAVLDYTSNLDLISGTLQNIDVAISDVTSATAVMADGLVRLTNQLNFISFLIFFMFLMFVAFALYKGGIFKWH